VTSAIAAGAATNPGDTVLGHFVSLGSGEAGARLLSFAGTLWVARQLGASEYSVIAFASAVMLYMTKLADFGIDAVGTDELAKRPDDIDVVGSAVFSMRLALAALWVAVSMTLALVFLRGQERIVLLLYALSLVPSAASTRWIHLAIGATRLLGVARAIGEALSLALVLAMVHDSLDTWKVPAAVLAGETLVALVLFRAANRGGRSIRWRWNPEVALPIFRRALPILGVFVAGLLIYNLDIFFLRVMRPGNTVGVYAASYALVAFVANLCTAFGLILVPALTRLDRGSFAERHLYQTAMVQIVGLTLPVAIGGLLVADRAIGLAYGDAYAAGGPVLRILAWIAALYALRVVGWAALVAHGHERLALRAVMYGVAVNVALNALLIGAYGMFGAASASVLTEAVVAAITLLYAQRENLPIAPLLHFWRPAVAAALMAAVLWMLWDAPIALQLAAGGVSYLLVLVALERLHVRNAGAAPAV
jgi:polysaccharide transporter, PST family